jgi:hypothetical protein
MESASRRTQDRIQHLRLNETRVSLLAGSGIAVYLLCRYILHMSVEQCRWPLLVGPDDRRFVKTRVQFAVIQKQRQSVFRSQLVSGSPCSCV